MILTFRSPKSRFTIIPLSHQRRLYHRTPTAAGYPPVTGYSGHRRLYRHHHHLPYSPTTTSPDRAPIRGLSFVMWIGILKTYYEVMRENGIPEICRFNHSLRISTTVEW